MIARVLRILRERSPAELRERLAQRGAAALERAGVVRGGGAIDAPDEPPRLASGVDDPAFGERFGARWPGETAAIIARADRLLDGHYDLLGYPDLAWGREPDWQLDPVAGLSAPLVHWSRVPYLNPAAVGDHKVTWELNRHQWMLTLAQAWRLTADERYARAVATRLDGWLRANPPKRGINWASSLELAFRAIAWCWLLRLLDGAPGIDASLRGRLLASLDLQGRHIERYLSTYFSPNTHLTGEALALYHLGVALPALPRAGRWRERGWDILTTEASRQIRPDGVYFEQTSWYQAYTVDFYLHAIRLRRSRGEPVPAPLLERVTRAADVLAAITRPDGRIPLLGDDDGGRYLPLRVTAHPDMRDTLALAALTLGRPSLKPDDDAPASALAWITTTAELDAYSALPAAPARPRAEAFRDGGWFVVRDGDVHLVIDGGPHGALSGAHAHADALGVDLAVRGRRAITDPGTFTYLGAERDTFRGTAAHATVEVDGTHSSEAGGPFRWHRFARTEVVRWIDAPAFAHWEAVDDGYMHGPEPVTHRRAILWLRGRYGVVLDRVEGEGAHRAAARFPAGPGVKAAIDGPGRVQLSDPAGDLLTLVGDGELAVESGWSAPVYGNRVAIPVVTRRTAFTGRMTFVTAVVAGPSADGPASCTRSEAGGGEAWLLRGAGWTDLLLLRLERTARCSGVQTEADLVWCRRDADGVPIEVIAIGAGELRVDEELVSILAGGAVRATRDGGRWVLEEA